LAQLFLHGRPTLSAAGKSRRGHCAECKGGKIAMTNTEAITQKRRFEMKECSIETHVSPTIPWRT